MISGNSKTRTLAAIAALATALAAPATLSAGLEAGTLIERLARPIPAVVDFTEARFSPLLQMPLIVSGQLECSGPHSFDRRIQRPYRETTRIRGDSVRVERDGEPVRSFGLKRAPELRGLLAGFAGLLSGDIEALERDFEIAVRGEPDDWQLTLTPRAARARNRLRIEVHGAGDEPRCFTMLNASGASIMLLGQAAQKNVPAAVTLESLQQHCDDAGAQRAAWDADQKKVAAGIAKPGLAFRAAHR